jgi:predicted DsbA family dithiol-disulfide isomerase
MTKLSNIRIDIVSDIMCPWCIVGYKRLEQALATFEGTVNAELHWQPFELNPGMPTAGQNLGEHIAEKYGSTPEQSEANRHNLTKLGQSLGFQFNFTPESRIYNTFKAHQLLHWAGEQSKQHALKLALFSAYFTGQQDPSDIEVLVAAATQVGLNGEEARALLVDGRFADTVRVNQKLWTSSGIQAVPAFILEQKYLISGAQEPASIVQAIQQVIDEAQ